MPLEAGTRLGPYEIEAPIGAGGMGEVYRARDTRLDRVVALKILPERLSADPQLRQRFEREARTVSALNHPHICVLHDIGSQDGVDYLVMEHLEGESLAARLERGALPLAEALRFGVEIADALDKAHRQGVVHRDLKPGNIMLTKGGAKLLDFGLAKATRASTAPISDSLPTVSEPLTGGGTLLGTFQYMAPETLEGAEADARSDIFALGAVLYEMASGRRAFDGRSQASVIAAILERQPSPLTELQPMAPPALDRLARSCLAKDPEERVQSAHDVRLQLEWIRDAGSQADVTAPVAARRAGRERRLKVVAVILALVAVAATVTAAALWRSATASAAPVYVEINVPEVDELLSPALNHVVISPDGSRVAFVARKGDDEALWVRSLDATTAVEVAGTAGASYPFWSPDGRHLGFFADGKLKKVPAGGGLVQTLADAPNGRGGSWSRHGVILFTPDLEGVLFRVADSGGVAEPATRTAGADDGARTFHRLPHFLPDGKRFLFVDWRRLMAGALDSDEVRPVLEQGSGAVYADGHLLFVRDGTLFAQPFDPARLRLRGAPTPLVEVEFLSARALGNFSVSETGMLVYRPPASSAGELQGAWYDPRTGQVTPIGLRGQEGATSVRLSPEGRYALVARWDMAARQSLVELVDVRQGGIVDLGRFASEQINFAFSEDGRRALVAPVAPEGQLYLLDLDRPGQLERVGTPRLRLLSDWDSVRDLIVFAGQFRETGMDVMVQPLDGSSEPVALVRSAAANLPGRLSPDGRLLTFMSDRSGRMELYATQFSGPGAQWQLTGDGIGGPPTWSSDGTSIYYLDRSRRLMAIPVERGEGIRFGEPEEILTWSGGLYYAETIADGRLLVVVSTGDEEAIPRPDIRLILNWQALLER